MTGLLKRITLDKTILSNAVAFFGSTVATSGLGFAYTWLAARLFEKEVFGLAQAGVSAMMLLAGMALLGLTTLLVGELPRAAERAPRLIMAALLASGAAGAVLGVLFGLVAHLFSEDLGELLGDPLGITLFTLGVILATVTQVFDYAMVGLLRSGLQLWRNIISSAVKVLALLAVVWLDGTDRLVALAIYSVWTFGHIVSLAAMAGALKRRGGHVLHPPDWPLMRQLSPLSLKHHLLNISWQAPSWVFPLLVVSFLGASANASFYIAWMIFFIVFMVPNSLTTVLYAVNSADVSLLAQKTRFTLRTSLALTVLACLILIPAAPFVLSIFGSAYAEEATTPLRLLLLTVFALIVKQHYLAISQVHRRIGRATRIMALGAALEIGGAAAGVALGGLSGLVIGMLVGQLLEASLMIATVYRTATGDAQPPSEHEPSASAD